MIFNVPFKYTMPDELPLNLIFQEEGRGKLYLGNLDSAVDKKLLRGLQISRVLSIVTEERVQFSRDFVHLLIEVQDKPETDILGIFEDSFNFIDNGLFSGSNVLVHCAAGISRSASLVIAYIMRRQKTILQHALKLVKKERPCVRPNPGFLMQLLDFERQLFGSIYSHLSAQLTPFDVQRDPKYQPKRDLRSAVLTRSQPLRKVSGTGNSFVRSDKKLQSAKLTKVALCMASFQPKAFNIYNNLK